jgi:hypothetical protein
MTYNSISIIAHLISRRSHHFGPIDIPIPLKVCFHIAVLEVWANQTGCRCSPQWIIADAVERDNIGMIELTPEFALSYQILEASWHGVRTLR